MPREHEDDGKGEPDESHSGRRPVLAREIRGRTNARACCLCDSIFIGCETFRDDPCYDHCGEDNDNKQDQIKFRLSHCVFEYGDFRESKRDEESVTHQYEDFLVVASSKGDTLSLFEPKDYLSTGI